MRVVKLKEDFIGKAVEVEPEFEQKHWRGYALIITERKTSYLIPLRSNCKHPYCFKNEISNKFLDFTKSFELNNDKIIDSTYSLDKREYDFYQRNIGVIRKELMKFNKNRKKFRYSVNIDTINKLQKNYKG